MCGGGAGDFKWTMFSQGFSPWLLPWIALVFQLPFGATDSFDNIFSAFMAIGSPALAGYSLAITRLNGRWLARQFSYPHFPNKDHIPLVVSTLQHIPFTIDALGPLLPSLIVLPQNDRYWKVLGAAAKRSTRQLSIPVAVNIIWTIVAFAFTIVDSFMSFDGSITIPGDAGYPTAAVWTYLLPLVLGWLYVGSQPEANHLLNALEEAEGIAYVATATESVLATRVTEATGRSTRTIEPSTKHIDYVNADEKRTAPIFHYSRVFIWSQTAEHILRLYEHAATKADRRVPVRRGAGWMSNDGTILAHNRIGTEAEVEQYCMEEYKAFNLRPSAMRSVFATGVFQRVAFATALALGLQWGTTGVAILIHLNTPPKGIGCRAIAFTVYGAAATVAFGLLLLSSLLAHLARPQSIPEERSALKIFTGCIATSTRWFGKVIAVLNGFGILVSCIMQFTGVYDNCFCSSTIFGGNPDGLVLFPDGVVKGSEVHGYWVGGIVVAIAISGLYTFVIFVATPMG